MFLTVLQVASEMSQSRESVYRLIRRGELPVVTVGGRLRVPSTSFRAWLAGLEREALESVRK